MSAPKNRTVIVTGGAQGIGRGIAEYLLARDTNVVIADIDREAGEELLDGLDTAAALFVPTDVGDEVSAQRCIEQALNRFGGLHGLVNNAGIADPGRTPVTELELADWNRMLRTNLTGGFLMTKHAAAALAADGGAIVNISSTRALQSEPNTEAYAASKGGLVALTHALAVSLGDTIRVNAILPGWIDVSDFKKKRACYDPGIREADRRQHPVGRVGKPGDVAALAAFLLSEEAGFITGQCFVVDGGMTRKMIYLD